MEGDDTEQRPTGYGDHSMTDAVGITMVAEPTEDPEQRSSKIKLIEGPKPNMSEENESDASA